MSTKNIDWSKAPEGATHWAPAKGMMCASFMKYEGGKWYCETASGRNWTADNTNDDPARYIARPTDWAGSGLPPVGTACEWLDSGSDRWLPVEIVFLSSWVIVVRDANPHPNGSVDLAFDLINEHPQFRAVRTPEQIAAEEREKAAKQICRDAGSPEQTAGQMAIAYRLYDAGYRKVDPAGAQP